MAARRLALSPEARADDIATCLAAAGFAPRLQDREDHIAIETELPNSVSAESWHELLLLLQKADSFGLDSSESGRTLRVAVRKNTPATTDVVRGHGHQL
ncbi:hypothetical protein [Streptomyces sp. NBC_01217]|uniref:hypothetical protein n=1 Tax=Streptomyces sp. NBC_01217 TaxID=2903779 RepID=UPI002E114153|nr:hypothetical protein OG507_20755 [Streptomyces sp. NBC_01217]